STLPDSVLVSPLSAVPAGMAGASFTHEEFYPSTSATALRTGVPVAEEDYARRAHALGVAGMVTYGLRSAVSVPMTSAGSFTGVLYAADAQPLRFGESEIAFLQQLANVLSSAMSQSASKQKVLFQARHDALTGLPNRGVLRTAIETSLAAALPAGGETGLLLLDLDGFKDVNDSLGHAAGDLVLEQVAMRLSAAAGKGSLVARLGGDEFAVCFGARTSAAQLEAAADRLTGALLTPFDVAGLGVPLSASIGLVVAPDHGSDASTLLRHADVAMYRAKAQRTGWAMYDEQVDHARAVRLTSISELRQAIRDGDLELHYQPIVTLSDGRCAEVEALVRWRHATRGLIYPGDFVPLAEQTGLIGELTAWVIERAVSDLEGWRGHGRPLRCAVNLSVDALTHRSIARDLVDRVIEHRDIITVEITESALADARATRTLRELAAAGVSCAIDDFGTGYSSLAALKSLPVSTLKIDREFVRDLVSSSQDLAIIRSVVQLAAALSLAVIAEGVETLATGERLAEMGIELAQGFYYARPMPAADVGAWLAAHDSSRPADRR
ncbi:MAG: EAL domain-containing protein, partial [Mycobacteriales bacterium]